MPAAKRARVASLTYGSDFSGIDMPGFAFKALGVSVRHRFASDSNPVCRQLLQHLHGPDLVYTDAVTRTSPPRVDVYTAGFPCQPFSMAGLRGGTQDAGKGMLGLESVRYCLTSEPTVAIFENVPTFCTTYRDYMQTLIDLLERKFHVTWQILRTDQYGLPQRRKRWYLVAFNKKRCPHLDTAENFPWPQAFGPPPPLSRFITPVPGNKFLAAPAGPPGRRKIVLDRLKTYR